MHRAESELRLVQRISRFFAKTPRLPNALRLSVEWVAEFLHAESGLLYLTSGDELVLCAAAGPSQRAVGEVRLRLDEGLTGWVARERRLLAISREAYLDPRFKYFRDLPEDTFEAFLSAPVIARNRVVGVINIQHRQHRGHTGEEMELLTTVGEQLGGLVTIGCVEAERFDTSDFAEMVLGQSLAARG